MDSTNLFESDNEFSQVEQFSQLPNEHFIKCETIEETPAEVLNLTPPNDTEKMDAPFPQSPISDLNNLQCLVCKSETLSKWNLSFCNNCYHFFRRVVIMKKTYSCKFNGECVIVKRTGCRSCRYKRCLQAGMGEYIKYLERKSRRKKVLQVECEQLAESSNHKNDQVAIKLENIVVKDLQEVCIVKQLVYVEENQRKIRKSSSVLSFLDDYRYFLESITLKELLTSNENILCKAKYFSETPITVNMQYVNYVMEHEEILNNNPYYVIFDLMMNIFIFKTSPIFDKISLDDQEILLRYSSLPAYELSAIFYSFQQNEQIITMPDGIAPDLYFRKRIASFPEEHKQILFNLLEKIYVRSLEPFKRANLNVEEFLLLRALVFLQPLAPGLSEHGQILVLTEADKYSKAMLHLMQRNMGESAGARKYAEVIVLIELLHRIGQKHREFFVCLDMIVPMKKLPKCITMCTSGIQKMPEIEPFNR